MTRQDAQPSHLDCPLGFGSQHGYTSKGCRCEACGAAVAAAQRRLVDRRIKAGGRPLTATAEETERAREQIVILTSLGWTQRTIAHAGRVSERPVTTIASGKVTRPRLETVEAIGRAYERLTSSTPGAEKSATAGAGASYMPLPAHGTMARYRRGCTCRACRSAYAQRRREYAARRSGRRAA